MTPSPSSKTAVSSNRGPVVEVFARPRTPAARRFMKSVLPTEIPAEIQERALKMDDRRTGRGNRTDLFLYRWMSPANR